MAGASTMYMLENEWKGSGFLTELANGVLEHATDSRQPRSAAYSACDRRRSIRGDVALVRRQRRHARLAGTRGISPDNCVWGNIHRHNASCCYNRALSNPTSGENYAALANPHIVIDEYGFCLG